MISEIEKIVERAQKGDKTAFKEIISEFRTYVYQRVRKRVPEKESINKLVTEVFNMMWENIGYYDKTRGAFNSWINEIIHSVCTLKHVFLEDNEPLSYEIQDIICRHIKSYYENPENRDSTMINQKDLEEVLSLEEYTLILLKYMYKVSAAELSKALGKKKRDINNAMIMSERKLIFHYKRGRVYEKIKKRKDD